MHNSIECGGVTKNFLYQELRLKVLDMVTYSNNPTIFSMSSQNNNKQILGIQNDTRQGKKKGKFEYFGKK